LPGYHSFKPFTVGDYKFTNQEPNHKPSFFISSFPPILTGALTSVIYFLIEVKGRPPADLASRLGEAPWWAWSGGVIGALFVIINILTIPKLGAGTTSAIIVCAQLVFSCIIDNFQFFGITYRTYTVWRGLATAGLIGCVAAIAKF
jgi:transporter family-2 protein